jgi:hypothetical protein
MLLVPFLLAACGGEASPGVYRSGTSAVARGPRQGEILVWGPAGTQHRVATEGPDHSVYLGESGPLWVVDHELPTPPKAYPVDATIVESVGYRMKDLLVEPGTIPNSPVADAARSSGVYVRSTVKVRQAKGPPHYVVTATGDEVGAGAFGGPADVREGVSCKAALAVFDHKGEKMLASVPLTAATRTCAVPVIVPPVDRDGDGTMDVLVYGQNGKKGFRSWFALAGDGLVAGPEDSWEDIP